MSDAVVVGLGQPVGDVLGQWGRLREVGDEGCVLVLPDRFVAWLSQSIPEDPKLALRHVMARILGRAGGA